LIVYLTDTLTVPKVKDLVMVPSKKYEEMFSVLHSRNGEKQSKMRETHEMSDFKVSLESEKINMKNELKNFLKEKMQSSSTSMFPVATEANVSSIDSLPSFSSYL